MNNSKEFILFIPGIGVKEPEEFLEKLVSGISNYCNGKGLPFQKLEDNLGEGTGQRRFEVTLSNGNKKNFFIQETYWGDLRPLLSSESVMRKVIRGLALLLFWTTSMKTWKRARKSKFMMFNMVFTLLLLLSWYYGALAAAFTAIGADPGKMLHPSISDFFKTLGDHMGGWYVWVATSMVIGVFPVTEVINISYATKCYLQNRGGMFYKVQGRVGKALAQILQSPGEYDRITVLSHSFGTVVGTEVLANYNLEKMPKIRMVTLGGPLLIIAARSDRVQLAMGRILSNPGVESWVDFYSHNDWLCTYSPVPKEVEKFKSRPITSTVPFDEKVNGASHGLYFDDWDVIESLLN